MNYKEKYNEILRNFTEQEITETANRAYARIQEKLSLNPNISAKVKSELQKKIIENEMKEAIERTPEFKKLEEEVNQDFEAQQAAHEIYYGE